MTRFSLIVILLAGLVGCRRGQVGSAIEGLRKLQPQAEKRNEELRDLSGSPRENNP